MSGFGLVWVAIDDYPEPPGQLPSSVSAARLAGLLGGRGATVLDTVVAASEQEVVGAFRRWAGAAERPSASVVYLVCHGRGDGLDHNLLVPVPDGEGVVDFLTVRLAEFLQHEWQSRQADPASWTLLILDCCDSELGTTNLDAHLKAKYPKLPRRLGLWPVAPGGAARAGAFVDAFERALDSFTENDEHIPLNAIFHRICGDLGNLESSGFLPDHAALAVPPPASPTVIPLDVHAEFREAIAKRPPEVRNHFLSKAGGGEAGEVAWHFCGRERETAELCDWLESGSGLRVVTGEPGSGKSALLGHLIVLSDGELVDLYASSGLAPHLADGRRPPDDAFGAVVHLTGKTTLETIHDLAAQLGVEAAADDLHGSVRALVAGVRATRQQGSAVLVDALDESQDPEQIAGILHDVAVDGALRFLVGTRRSQAEDPDEAADPTRRELLDALRVDHSDVLVVTHDPEAIAAYAEQRLAKPSSPYASAPEVAATLAQRIADFEQPFLFARLATAELLARPAFDPEDAALGRLLGAGHRGVFAGALERIAAADSDVHEMLRALAYARGRGLPRTGGTWGTLARAVGEPTDTSDDQVDATLEAAAPYVTLDAEAGHGTYRLAHQTFAEHFRASPTYGGGHRRIADALAAPLRDDPERWVAANYYTVRYLPEHLVADADEVPPDADGLIALATDAGWLVAAVNMLGVDRAVELVAAARAACERVESAEAESDEGMPLRVVDAVERTLRRSRIALSRYPGQLPAMLHARLKDESDPELATIGERVALITGQPWLRMVDGRLDWRADLETTYRLAGKVRALGFGEIDGPLRRPVVAIAVDDRVVLWDPRHGVSDEAVVVDLDGRRATGVAIADIDSRTVVVTSADYDGETALWDAKTGRQINRVPSGLGHTLTVGRLNGRVTVAGVRPDGEACLLDVETLQAVDAAPHLPSTGLRAFAAHKGALVAITDVRDDHDGTRHLAVVDIASGRERWRSGVIDDVAEFEVVAAGQVGSVLLVVAAAGDRLFWVTDHDLYVEPFTYSVRVRALAVGSAGGRTVVAVTPDYDDTALVVLREGEQTTGPHGETVVRPRSQGDPGQPGLGVGASHEPVFESGLMALFEEQTSWPDTLSFDQPEKWPRTALAEGVLEGKPVVVTGSLEGAVWVWDLTGDRPKAIAGPFARVSQRVLDYGWRVRLWKPAPPEATSVAIGRHAGLGPILAVASDGRVRLYKVPTGEAVTSPTEDATAIEAVDLGGLGDRDVLVTGSKSGVLGVWSLLPPQRLAVLTLDTPIAGVKIIAEKSSSGEEIPDDAAPSRVAVTTAAGLSFVIEFA
jgi:WD40 repeat protein